MFRVNHILLWDLCGIYETPSFPSLWKCFQQNICFHGNNISCELQHEFHENLWFPRNIRNYFLILHDFLLKSPLSNVCNEFWHFHIMGPLNPTWFCPAHIYIHDIEGILRAKIYENHGNLPKSMISIDFGMQNTINIVYIYILIHLIFKGFDRKWAGISIIHHISIRNFENVMN